MGKRGGRRGEPSSVTRKVKSVSKDISAIVKGSASIEKGLQNVVEDLETLNRVLAFSMPPEQSDREPSTPRGHPQWTRWTSLLTSERPSSPLKKSLLRLRMFRQGVVTLVESCSAAKKAASAASLSRF